MCCLKWKVDSGFRTGFPCNLCVDFGRTFVAESGAEEFTGILVSDKLFGFVILIDTDGRVLFGTHAGCTFEI